ncbi:hypothetical protein ANN_02739 [Periplaneta americana]|uniref:FHA domain-containing protein n=1 Tax=Periplaneta americana TaxID=6978 RepID=A0ABQ8TZL2_PERAM|nr:hypothetical protein ANN_02739 [Periplaneta americana]
MVYWRRLAGSIVPLHCHNPGDPRNETVRLTGFLEFGKDVATLPPREFDGNLSILLNEGCDCLLTGEDKIFVTVRKTFIYDNQLVGGSRRSQHLMMNPAYVFSRVHARQNKESFNPDALTLMVSNGILFRVTHGTDGIPDVIYSRNVAVMYGKLPPANCRPLYRLECYVILTTPIRRIQRSGHRRSEVVRSGLRGGQSRGAGFRQELVAQERCDIIDELKDAVRRGFQHITLAMPRRMSHRTWRRIILCEENDGRHTDLLDT